MTRTSIVIIYLAADVLFWEHLDQVIHAKEGSFQQEVSCEFVRVSTTKSQLLIPSFLSIVSLKIEELKNHCLFSFKRSEKDVIFNSSPATTNELYTKLNGLSNSPRLILTFGQSYTGRR